MPQQPPLAESYGAKVALVLLALCPNIVVTTAVTLLTPALEHGLGASGLGIQLAEGLSNAGYAFGAVLAAALLRKLDLRRVLVASELVFVAGSALAAAAPGIAAFGLGRVLEGFATGLLLVFALPPLVTRFPVARLPVTVAVVNVGLFGAVTVGPLLGGLAAGGEAWRLFFAVLAALGLAGCLVGLVSVAHQAPSQPDQPVPKSGLVLAAAGTALPFFAVSELAQAPFLSPLVIPPLVIGLGCLVALVLASYHRRAPLMPVRLLSSTLPVTGILAAMVAGAGFVALLELAQTFLVKVDRVAPLAAGLAFWPEVAGIALASVVFGAAFRSRYVPLLVAAGMVVLVGAGAGLSFLSPGSGPAVVAETALALGFGAGATVSPGLFLAALAVPSSELGPAFALVELLRSEAAFLVGPVLLHVAMASGKSGPALARGIRTGVWASLGLLAAGSLAIVGLFVAGRGRLHRPDLEEWVGSGGQALESHPVGASVRDRLASH